MKRNIDKKKNKNKNKKNKNKKKEVSKLVFTPSQQVRLHQGDRRRRRRRRKKRLTDLNVLASVVSFALSQRHSRVIN